MHGSTGRFLKEFLEPVVVSRCDSDKSSAPEEIANF